MVQEVKCTKCGHTHKDSERCISYYDPNGEHSYYEDDVSFEVFQTNLRKSCGYVSSSDRGEDDYVEELERKLYERC